MQPLELTGSNVCSYPSAKHKLRKAELARTYFAVAIHILSVKYFVTSTRQYQYVPVTPPRGRTRSRKGSNQG